MGSVDVRSIADEELLDADANILDDNNFDNCLIVYLNCNI